MRYYSTTVAQPDKCVYLRC